MMSDSMYKRLIGYGVFVWIAADVITTAIGFSIGMMEHNPILANMNIYEIAIIKLISGALFYFLATRPSVVASRWRYISLSVIWIMGILICALNSYAITVRIT